MIQMVDASTIDQLFQDWHAGSDEARDLLFVRMHKELRSVAGGLMRGQSRAHTLQPTALVNEACLRLCKKSCAPQDHAHFLHLAAVSMRQILVDHARKKNAAKRGGGEARVPLEGIVDQLEQRSHGLLELDRALGRLAKHSPELVKLVELRFFAGLPVEEVAAVLGISAGSTARRWLVAKAFLHDELTCE